MILLPVYILRGRIFRLRFYYKLHSTIRLEMIWHSRRVYQDVHDCRDENYKENKPGGLCSCESCHITSSLHYAASNVRTNWIKALMLQNAAVARVSAPSSI